VQSAGYEGVIHFCADGNVSNHVTVGSAQNLGFRVTSLGAVRFLMRLLKPVAEQSGSVLTTESDVDCFLRASGVSAPLARVWSRAEAEWQCRKRTGSICVTHCDGASAGVLAGYRMAALDAAHTECVFLDDILWQDLNAADRRLLLDRFVNAAAAEAQIVVVPQLGYADMTTFGAAGFMRSRRLLHAYLTTWGNDTAPDISLPPVYIDVV
jgi:hypothetical protein